MIKRLLLSTESEVEVLLLLRSVIVCQITDFAKFSRKLELCSVDFSLLSSRLMRWRKGSQMWSPNQKRLVNAEAKGQDLCAFINKLSLIDAGSKEAALTVKYVDE